MTSPGGDPAPRHPAPTADPPTDGVRIGAFVFDRVTGDLTGDDGAQRLPPQPAALLALLLEQPGTLVTRDAIRARLWPDVHVEFDQSLHFCVRQLRAAFGEAADAPQYIETLPRRGYRLIAAVDPVEAPSAPTGTGPARPRRRVVPLALVFAFVLVLGGATWLSGILRAPAAPIRLAIMSFVAPDAGAGPSTTTTIADHLLARLGADPAFAVVGPTSTSAFDADDAPVARVVERFAPTYVVNGRFIGDGAMLGEVIRASDGAHVWVHRFDVTDDAATVAAIIDAGLREALDRARLTTSR
ncbi:MAG: winged helix-turn-helix domain-containing protein [Phycisphaerales bacterium]|nr:winged helix-turn-helix domain-containing protein [Phycisphaerales bacterium]